MECRLPSPARDLAPKPHAPDPVDLPGARCKRGCKRRRPLNTGSRCWPSMPLILLICPVCDWSRWLLRPKTRI